MTPQTGVFPRIHTSYNTYKLLIHEMTHELPTKAIRAQLRGRCRSDAAPTPLRRRSGTAPDGPEASPAQTGASPEPAGAGTAAPSAGTPRTIRFRRRAPDDPSPATARRAVVIGLQPAANGRGCGLCV